MNAICDVRCATFGKNIYFYSAEKKSRRYLEVRICLYNPAEDDPGIADSDATSSYASIADPPSY